MSVSVRIFARPPLLPPAAADGKVRVSVTVPAEAAPQDASVTLVIDRSGSMAEAANESCEMRMYSKMDLVKYGAELVARALHANAKNRLAIIAFDHRIDEVLPPTLMDDAGLRLALSAIASIEPDGGTALWNGLKAGLTAALTASGSPSVVFLTDGKSNWSPPEGEVAALAKFRDDAQIVGARARIIVVGFGGNVNSALLAALGGTQAGDGYGQVPDGSMLITAFTHFMANELCVVSKGARLVTAGGRTIEVGPLRAGQRRDFIIDAKDAEGLVLALAGGEVVTPAGPPVEDDGAVSEEVARQTVIGWLETAIETATNISTTQAKANLVSRVGTLLGHGLDPAIGKDVMGEVALALSDETWPRWGQHYLRALLAAHSAQLCTNHKDFGVQGYGGAAFRAHQAKLNELCDTMSPPSASLSAPPAVAAAAYRAPPAARAAASVPAPTPTPVMAAVDFARLFIAAEGGCFGGDALVDLADGSSVEVKGLRKGDVLASGAAVECVTVRRRGNLTVRFFGNRFTPRHPVRVGGSQTWVHPGDPAFSPVFERSDEPVFNLVLDGQGEVHLRSTDPRAPTATVVAVTLGHGKEGPIVGHGFYGTPLVVEALRRLPGWKEGLVEMDGVRELRDDDGYVCGYAAKG